MLQAGSRIPGLAAAVLLAVSGGGAANAQTSGQAVFEARCKDCHEPAVDRAPSREDLAALIDRVDSLNNELRKLGGTAAPRKKAAAKTRKRRG